MLFISLISSMPLLYDRTLNTASATSEGPTATFEPTINLTEDQPPIFVEEDVDNHSVSSEGQNVYVVWGAANGTAYFRASHDGGKTFGAPMILSIFGPAPRIISTGEHVYVEYINNHSHLSFRASHDYGVTFDAPIDLGPLGGVIDGTPYDGQMALSGSNVYLTWIRVDDVGGGKVDGHFYFRASHDNGVTFDPLMSLNPFDDFTSVCCLQKIAAYGNHVYVVMSGNLLRASNDNGVTFGPIIDLGSTAIDIAASGSNLYHLGNLFIRVSHDGGVTFDPAFNLGSPFPGDVRSFPQMAVIPAAGGGNSDDAVYVVWQHNESDCTTFCIVHTSIRFRASNDSGATFGDVVTLAEANCDPKTACVLDDDARIAALGNEVYVTFRSFVSVSDSFKIFFTMSSDRGATFGPFTEVVDSDVYLNVPKLAASSSTNVDSEKTDNIFVTWQEENRGTSAGDVFLRAARFIPLQYNLNLFEGTNPSGQTLDLGQEARAVVSTTDPSASQVNFTWNNPSGETVHTDLVPLSLTGQAESMFTPDEVGRWTVVADFGNGVVRQQTFDVRLLVIPESPIGTLALIASSMTALTLYGIRGIHRRKQGK